MSKWNPEQYLKFEKQRTQPSVDLVKSLLKHQFESILDIGCGPGNSTAVLKEYFKSSEILGIDSSSQMIETARKKYPNLNFEQKDARKISEKYSLIFSNACLQWVENHETLLPYLMDHLNYEGILAVQMPKNSAEPLYEIINEMISSEKWDFSLAKKESNITLEPEEYYNILSNCATDFSIWETVYYHIMPSHEALIDWVRETRLRPYLSVLSGEEKKDFEEILLEKVKKAYTKTDSGDIIFRFRRLFFIASKGITI